MYRATTTATVTGPTMTGKPQELPRKKTHQKEGRLVPGGTKMQSLIMRYGNTQTDRDLGKARHGESGWKPRKKAGEV